MSDERAMWLGTAIAVVASLLLTTAIAVPSHMARSSLTWGRIEP